MFWKMWSMNSQLLSAGPWNIGCKLPYVVSPGVIVCNNQNSSIFASSQSHAKFLAISPNHLGKVTWKIIHVILYSNNYHTVSEISAVLKNNWIQRVQTALKKNRLNTYQHKKPSLQGFYKICVFERP